jgi:hypothetical protein
MVNALETICEHLPGGRTAETRILATYMKVA